MMTWSWRLERAYWAGEWPLLWRRGWWLLPTLLILAMMNAIPFVGQLIDWTLAGMIVVIVLRRILAARHFDTLLQLRWQADVAKSVVASWPTLARNLRLEVKDLSGVALVTGAGRPGWDGYTCVLPVSMPPGLAREDLVAVTPRIAQAFNAVRVTVVGQQIGALALRIEYVDALAQQFSFPLGMPWESNSVLMGVADGGGEWRLALRARLRTVRGSR